MKNKELNIFSLNIMITKGIQLNFNPKEWQEHLFGLPEKKWSSLKDKSFWITGAGTGYGRCLAIALASAGAQVIMTGRREQKLQETIEEMKKLDIPNNKCHILTFDITDFSQVEAACSKVTLLCDTLYGLVNNAALPSRGDVSKPLLDGSIKDWQKIINTNVTAPWFLTRTIFAHMAKGGAVRVLFLSSEAGWAFTPGFGPYNVSKAALNNLGASMAAECAASYPNADIQMNILVPGEARTEMNQGSSESPYAITNIALILLSHPKGGPNGKFFHKDGKHMQFTYSLPYEKSLL